MELTSIQAQQQLGTTIRRLRKQQGYSQESFADHCGMHRTYMGEIERGEANLTIVTILKVTDCLGVMPSVLFGEAGL